MDTQKILDQAQAWILGRLQERQDVRIPMIGTFVPKVEPEYLWHKSVGGGVTTVLLMPPRVRLAFTADDYILDGAHYASYGADVREVSLPLDLVMGVSGLLEVAEAEVRAVVREHLEGALRSIFRGRRQQLFDLCDLYMIEEKKGLLLLHMEPLPHLLNQLNYPFSSYSPVEVRPGINFPGIDESNEEYTNQIQQIPIRPVVKVEEIADEIPLQTLQVHPVPESVMGETTAAPQPVGSVVNQPTKGNKSFLPIVLTLLALVTLIVWFFFFRSRPAIVKPVPDPAPAPTTIIEKDTLWHIAEIPPIDTVTIGYGLTLSKLARRYYHNPKYWVYIYMNNRELISNPNNVPLGTVLEIPSLDKYHLLPDSLLARHEAIQWENIIQNGLFTSYDDQRRTLKPYEKK